MKIILMLVSLVALVGSAHGQTYMGPHHRNAYRDGSNLHGQKVEYENQKPRQWKINGQKVMGVLEWSNDSDVSVRTKTRTYQLSRSELSANDRKALIAMKKKQDDPK